MYNILWFYSFYLIEMSEYFFHYSLLLFCLMNLHVSSIILTEFTQ